MTDTFRGSTVVDTLVNITSDDMRGATAVETIANITGADGYDSLIDAIMAMYDAPESLRGDTVIKTIENIVRDYGDDSEVPDNVIDALLMLNDTSGHGMAEDGKNHFVVSKAINGYIGPNGVLNTTINDNRAFTSDYVPVRPGQSLVLQAWSLVTSNSSSGANGNIWIAYCFYTSSKTVIGKRTDKYGGTMLENGRAYSTYTVTAPENAAYIRFTYRRVLGGFAKIEYGTEATPWNLSPQDATLILGEARICHANDAAAMPPLGITVFGSSRQNGTPTPSTPVPITSIVGNIASYPYQQFQFASDRGVTYTQNADGTISAVGAATALAYLYLCSSSNNVYGLESGKSYTIAVDSVNVGTLTITGAASQAKRKTVTIPESGAWYVGVGVQAGIMVNETFRFSLYEVVDDSCTTAAVPYGCIAVQTHGANLLDANIIGENTVKGVTVKPDTDGWLSISGESTATSAAVIGMWGSTENVYLPNDTYTLLVETDGTPFVSGRIRLQVYGIREGSASTYITNAGAYQLDYPNGINRISINVGSSSGGYSVDGRFRLTLVNGTQVPTEYVPYVGNVLPIDLGGHELRSLPDGTSDFVSIGQNGKVTLIQQVAYSTFDGSDDEMWYNPSTEDIHFVKLWSSAEMENISVSMQSGRCDRYGTWDTSTLARMADKSFKIGVTTNGIEAAYFKDSDSPDSLKDFKVWLAENPITIAYKLPPEGCTTYDLGYVAPRMLPSPDFTSYVQAEMGTTMTMRYIRG